MVFGFITSIVSTISAVVSSIGPAVSNFCANVLPRIGPFIEKGIEVVRSIGNVAQGIFSAFNIFKPEEKVAEMGDRALQAAEQNIKPEDFDSTEKYIEKIRTLELDPEKSKRSTEIEKIVGGMAIGGKGLEEKLNLSEGAAGNLWVLAAANPDYFNANRLENLLRNTLDIGTVLRYFEGKLDLSGTLATGKSLLHAERTLHPEKTEKTILVELEKAEADVRKTAQAEPTGSNA